MGHRRRFSEKELLTDQATPALASASLAWACSRQGADRVFADHEQGFQRLPLSAAASISVSEAPGVRGNSSCQTAVMRSRAG
jgi:hypothetical protein